jgi:two-component system, sensor histidine kinase and response regulator
MITDPPFAISALQKLVGDHPDKIKRLLRIFITTTTPLLAELEQAVKQGDLRQLANLSHRLKSTARAIGADGVANLAITIEQRALAHDSTTLGEVAALQQALQRTLDALDGYIST